MKLVTGTHHEKKHRHCSSPNWSTCPAIRNNALPEYKGTEYLGLALLKQALESRRPKQNKEVKKRATQKDDIFR